MTHQVDEHRRVGSVLREHLQFLQQCAIPGTHVKSEMEIAVVFAWWCQQCLRVSWVWTRPLRGGNEQATPSLLQATRAATAGTDLRLGRADCARSEAAAQLALGI
mmetsp:Transcript_23553/g.73747  ORF Transcript_23553/g.73747 Transcript_23553/m.73747 type:complete len:105 (-) Transcript_23553:181-495(-)